MSNKPNNRLAPLDRALRKRFPAGMRDGVDPFRVEIEKVCGFELFNTRPYHNYETWSDGYIVRYCEGGSTLLEVQAEDLDEALDLLAKRIGAGK